MKIIATITDCVQTGMDEYKDVRTSKEFTEESTIGEIDRWAKSKKSSFALCTLSFLESIKL